MFLPSRNQAFPRRYASGTEENPAKNQAPPVRPEFPPSTLGFQPFFPEELGERTGGDLLFVWSFLHSFQDLLGVWSVRVGQLLQALVDGPRSQLLGELHIGMLRILQADMEEAHATGAMQVHVEECPPGGRGGVCVLKRTCRNVICRSILSNNLAWRGGRGADR
jgi:hypothetical protein